VILALSPGLAAAIAQAARASFPRECCGLVEGVWGEGGAHVVALHEAANIAAASDRFEIAPAAQFAALKVARRAGRAIIGCYHSHPNGMAIPSHADLEGAGEESFLWLVAALTAAEAPITLAGFVYSAGRFEAISLATGADLVTSSLKL